MSQPSGQPQEFRSGRLVIRVSPDQEPHRFSLDSLSPALREPYFGGGSNRNGPHQDTIAIATASGKPLLEMHSWSMVANPTSKQGSAAEQKEDPGLRVSAVFGSPADEHYYGLGQQQQGTLDLRDRRINCWHDYSSIGGENVCVPFLISTRGYGLVWDNPSKTTVDLGFNQQNVWSSDVADRVSFFVIAGDNTDEIYKAIASSPALRTCSREAFTATSRAKHLSDVGATSGGGQGVSRPRASSGCAGCRLPE